MAFQGTFAVITAALISGAVVERMRFSAYLLLIGLWVPLVYAPLCHWVWGGGWLADLGALDFAGGTVVHINAAAAALMAALMLGPRRDYGRQALLPHNVPLVMVVLPIRAGERQERIGLDVPLHGEEAYTSGEGAILVMPAPVIRKPAAATVAATSKLEPAVGRSS